MRLKLLITGIFVLHHCFLFAQNGVRIAATTGTADASAMLDVVSTTKGFLVPRLSLTGPALTNPAPVTSPADGLLIYNLGLSGVVQKGFYYWNATGATWVIMSAGALSGTGTINYFPKWTASNILSGTSLLYDNGNNVGVGTTSPVQKLNVGAGNNDGILIGNYNDQLGWNGSGTAPEYSIRFSGYRDVISNFIGAKISAIRTNICCSGLSQGTELSFQTQEVTATVGGDGNLIERLRIGAGGNVKLSSLAGTGIRPVFATSNGTLATTFPTAVVFSNTGANQTYTVPAGVTSITVKMWGAGGGGGYFGGWTSGFSGGGGGYTQGSLAVTPGQVLTIIVGSGGLGGNTANTLQSYGGGARSCNTGSDCRYGGQGGGRSAIRNAGGTELMTAGGGGGGGSSRNASLASYGGAGGGMVGQDGINDQYNYGGGKGGFPTAGGSGCTACTGNGTAGTQFAGGNPGSNAYGGGGGGGWYGGGGGGYIESNTMGGGGGGSGYIGGIGVSNAFTLTGYYMQPPKMDDVNYATGIGVGGLTIINSVPLQGGHGRVVIIPNQ